ncbi:unnamed protein product [Caenorhabditis angaria]|uniref:Uncharacterized protein n=1 Tax=Caenorhabditis angaria TaxID=860376 RepID=A0A9P1MUK1_9PELO|nr:unnamed protein product [Caenorhabditis angaria]
MQTLASRLSLLSSICPLNSFFESKSLIHLDLSHNKITSFSSHTFSKLGDLRVLDLSSNPIKMLPYKPFAKNNRLKWLKLSKSEIQTLNPDHFFGLSSLKTLTLSKMPLHNISPYAFVPLKNLRYLDMDSCNLTRIPHSVIYNCHLTKLNLANNKFHRSSSLPPEVLAGLSSLSQLRIEGNPLIEFPPSFLLISHQNHRLLRFLLHSTMTLPVWRNEPCTPYYWAMQMQNQTASLRHFILQYSEEKMMKMGLEVCKGQFEWMKEQMDIYKELEKNSGCYTMRKLRSSANSTAQKLPSSNKINLDSNKNERLFDLPHPFLHVLIASISSNFLLIFIIVSCTIIGCFSR